MKKIFSYNVLGNETADTLVTTFNSLVSKSIEGKNNTKEYQEANSEFNTQYMKYCVETIPNAVFADVKDISNPMIHSNQFFRSTFDTILAQAITPAVPTVVANGYNVLYDVTQVGFGDNARYTVDSNELFIVNDIAEGIARGGVQTTYGTEYTVTARRRQISIYVDWYHVASGKQDWGKMGQKIGASYAAYVQSAVAASMASIVSSAANYGVAGYFAAGAFSDQNWLTIARNVKLANGGADVYAMGTNLALAKVLPAASATSGFRYGEDGSIVKDGFLPSYKGVSLIEIGNALKPNTINGTPEVVLPDDQIYFIAMGTDKPIKVVIEGQNVVVSQDPLTTADHTYGMTVDMRIGVDAIVGSKFGCLSNLV